MYRSLVFIPALHQRELYFTEEVTKFSVTGGGENKLMLKEKEKKVLNENSLVSCRRLPAEACIKVCLDLMYYNCINNNNLTWKGQGLSGVLCPEAKGNAANYIEEVFTTSFSTKLLTLK